VAKDSWGINSGRPTGIAESSLIRAILGIGDGADAAHVDGVGPSDHREDGVVTRNSCVADTQLLVLQRLIG
jgi:hypothetical protein